MKYTLMALSMALLTAAPAAAADDAKKDLKDLEGEWQMVATTADGKESTKDEAFRFTMIIKADGKWTAYRDGDVFMQGTVKLDPSKKPKAADWAVKVKDKEATTLGIYNINRDVLQHCFAPEGKNRPEHFESKEGTKVIYSVYKRVPQ